MQSPRGPGSLGPPMAPALGLWRPDGTDKCKDSAPHTMWVYYMNIAAHSLTCHTATGTHMPHGITQCYLPPGRGDIPALTPAEAGTRLSDP